VRVDVDSDLVRNLDLGLVPAEAELAAEEEQEHENDNDQQHDGDHSAAAAATAGLDDRRAIGVAVVIGHGNSPCIRLFFERNERTSVGRVPPTGSLDETDRSSDPPRPDRPFRLQSHGKGHAGGALGAARDRGRKRRRPGGDAADQWRSGGAAASLAARAKGPIDPKSVEAAGQVVQHYGALVEQGRFLPAERLWNDIEAARSFAVALDAKFKDVHLEIGELGATEGAAGSIYTTVPVTFYGTSERGKPLRMPAAVILRRVNDVPGSTERQRRWHIERIEWKAVA